MKEYLDIFDENNKPLNDKKERKVVHEKGYWHREISVFIINENKDILIQKRAKDKLLAPDKWSLCAGHVDSGETIMEAAIREVKEEVGIKDIGPADFILFDIQKAEKKHGDIINNHYKYCYILKTNYKESDFVIQKEELSEVKYVSYDELKSLTKKDSENYTGAIKGKKLEDNWQKINQKLEEIEED